MNNITKLSSVSFFCPAYNDEKNLPILIPKVIDFLQNITDKFEVIIVEDGSPDKTAQVAEELAKKYPQIKVIHHEKNLGYGAALRNGFGTAVFDYVMYTDGDNQYDVREFLPHLNLLDNNDILSGYVRQKATSNARKLQSVIFNSVIRGLFGINIKDINCSMKLYKKAALDSIEIKSASAFIDAEMLISAKRKGFKIAQFPVTHYSRNHGLASGSKPMVIVDTIKDMLKFRAGLL
jgi:glycosyltransferase involved in cell wall biosynthesis